MKNFPRTWTEDNLRELFSKYGEIKSCVLLKAKLKDEEEESPFGFVCFDKEGDKEHGPLAAQKATEDINGKEFEPNLKIYVGNFLNKKEREEEKKKNSLRFKNSKKRFNLYTKNFPPNTTEEEIKKYFEVYGETESVKIFKKEGEAIYAFICFKNPDDAAKAKQNANQ